MLLGGRRTSRALLGTVALASVTRTMSTSIKLNDGRLHPQIGYGTYKVGFVPASASAAAAAPPQEGVSAVDCVAAALELGYRFLDCAEFYGN